MALRHAISEARLQEIEARIQAGAIKACARCGCDQDLRTVGCRTCNNRHMRRRLWATDAEYRARQNAARRRRHDIRRAGLYLEVPEIEMEEAA